mgnify:CR=1 FL=1
MASPPISLSPDHQREISNLAVGLQTRERNAYERKWGRRLCLGAPLLPGSIFSILTITLVGLAISECTKNPKALIVLSVLTIVCGGTGLGFTIANRWFFDMNGKKCKCVCVSVKEEERFLSIPALVISPIIIVVGFMGLITYCVLIRKCK